MLCILGATATGKTRLGVSLARHFGGEIISADSRQIYRGLDIGSGKDLDEYQNVPYHLIDIRDPGYEFNLFEFVECFSSAYQDILDRQGLPILVGGTGMYLDAVLNRYELTRSNPELLETKNHEWQSMDNDALASQLKSLNPALHNSTDLEDRHRMLKALEIAYSKQAGEPSIQAPHIDTYTIGIELPRNQIRERISIRLLARLQQGMIEEVESLHAQGVDWKQLEFYGLEYRYIAQYLQGELNRNDMQQKLNSAIHQFAKQQEKWFRNIQKKGHDIHWIPADGQLAEEATRQVDGFLESRIGVR